MVRALESELGGVPLLIHANKKDAWKSVEKAAFIVIQKVSMNAPLVVELTALTRHKVFSQSL